MPIDLEIKNYRSYSDADPGRIRIADGFTAIVGPNNAGKSSLLRLIYELREPFSLLASAGNWTNLVRGNNHGLAWPSHVLDPAEPLSRFNARDMSVRITCGDPYVDENGTPVPTAMTLVIKRENPRTFFVFVDGLDPRADTTMDGQFIASAGSTRLAVLRELADTAAALRDAYYIPAFRNTVNQGGSDRYYDLSIGSAFIAQWSEFQTGSNLNSRMQAGRIVETIRQVFGFNQFNIMASSSRDDLQVSVDDQPYSLGEQGAGLTHFVLSLVGAAIKRPTFIAIDEPETGLHPSLQRTFLTTLASLASRGVLFATHSYGLARSNAELVYVATKLKQATTLRPLERTPRLAEFLGEMSFAGYQELGFERLLLVEGPLDVRAVHQWLRDLKIDHRVVVLPLGGDSMINAHRAEELAEVLRITSDVHVLIDSERSEPGQALSENRAAFVNTCGELGIQICVLERRAIENYFPDDAVKRAFGDTHSALGPYELLRDHEHPWSKAANWRIAMETPVAALGADLREFLRGLKTPTARPARRRPR